MKMQRGMAVVMALLLVALSATVGSLVLWQQGLWWHQVESDRSRARMRLWLDAQVHWARSRLRVPGVVMLAQPWARPFQLRDQEYLLDARLQDMQARLNLKALGLPGGVINPQQLGHYRQLLMALQLSPSLADSLVRWLGLHPGSERAPAGGEGFQRPFDYWETLLRVPGYTPQVLARLRPYATVLADQDGRVNANTASPLLLQAMLPHVPAGQLARVLAQRERHYFLDEADFRSRLSHPVFPDGSFTAGSSWFLLQGTVRQGRYGRAIEALFQLDGSRVRLVWRREEVIPVAAPVGPADAQ